MALSHSPSIVRSGLVLHLDAANPKSYPGSGTVWTDLSGNGNNGTLINGVGFTSEIGGCLTFNGSNQYVSLLSTPQIAQSLYSSTVEIVAYRNRSNVFEVMFGGGLQSANAGFYVGFRASNGNNFMYAYYSNDQDGSTPSTNIAWNHYVATYNTANSSRFRYFNSSLLSPSESSGVTNTSANKFFIGAFNNNNSPSDFFQGKIASVKIYNRALTAAEISQNFEAHRGRFGR